MHRRRTGETSFTFLEFGWFQKLKTLEGSSILTLTHAFFSHSSKSCMYFFKDCSPDIRSSYRVSEDNASFKELGDETFL